MPTKTKLQTMEPWLRGIFTPYVQEYFPYPVHFDARYIRMVQEWKSYDGDRRRFEEKWDILLQKAFKDYGERLSASWLRVPVADSVVALAKNMAENGVGYMIGLLQTDVETYFLNRIKPPQKAAVSGVGDETPTKHLSTRQQALLRQRGLVKQHEMKARKPTPKKPTRLSNELIEPNDILELRSWNKTTLASKISKITKSTESRVRGLLAREIAKGTPITEIADLLLQFGFPPKRATMIARTEVIAASNAATFYGNAAAIDPKQMVKNWINTNDRRCRRTHIVAGASQKGIKYTEPFTVGGAKLMFPGDSSLGAPGRETIRCRCTMSSGYRR